MSATDVTWIAIWVVLVLLAVIREVRPARSVAARTIARGVLLGLLALLIILLGAPDLDPAGRGRDGLGETFVTLTGRAYGAAGATCRPYPISAASVIAVLGGARIRTSVAVLVASALGAGTSAVAAQGASSDLELRAAYCLGVEQTLEGVLRDVPDSDCRLRLTPDYPAICQKARQETREALQRVMQDIQHLQSYLVAKGFPGSDNSRGDGIAIGRGRADVAASGDNEEAKASEKIVPIS